MRNLLLTTFCLLRASQAFGEPELKGTANELAQYLPNVPKTVLVSGDADLHVPADRAVVSLKVTTDNKSLQEALRLNQDVRAKLSAYLKKQGIPAERAQASKFSSTPKFGLFGEKAKSYRVENVVKITVMDEKEFQGATGAVDWPEVQFVGADFEHADKEALKAKVLGLACERAEARKKVYEEKLGLILVPAAFVEGRVLQNLPLPILSEAVAQQKSGSARPSGAAKMRSDAGEVEESTSSFGELIYTAQVAVEYIVEKK